MANKIPKSDEEWLHCLTPQQFEVLRNKGTERAFTGELWDNHDEGRYVCAACNTELFLSDHKFESGTGWPSFYQAVNPQNVATEVDVSHGMRRVEVLCKSCGGHLGHLFPDGPPPTGQRFCINSVSLRFEKKAG
jgi:peptide-methionine (R)-S-oxide reductase